MNMSQVQFTSSLTSHPPSVCSRPCALNEARRQLEGDSCCWTCVPCSTYEYLPTPFECILCPLGSRSADDLLSCAPIPEEFLRYDNPASVVSASLAGLGILFTVYIIGLFIRHHGTPVVRASGRELTFVLLCGILICYAMTFVILAPPSDIVCAIQQFGVGFSFCVCYSALLVKTNRISRIFSAGRRTIRQPRFISPQSQLVICAMIVAIQAVVSFVWIVVSPPSAVHYHPSRDDNQVVCVAAVRSSNVVGLVYPFLLVVVCTVYAVKTRNIPEAFNESRHIGFTMYTTCIIWLAFIPIYLSTSNNIAVRLVTMSFSVSLSATVTLVCLFAPKLDIILLHPERNVRQSMMTAKSATPISVNQLSTVRVESGETDTDGKNLN